MKFIVHFAGENMEDETMEIHADSPAHAEERAREEANKMPDCEGWLVEDMKEEPNPFQYGDIPFFGE